MKRLFFSACLTAAMAAACTIVPEIEISEAVSPTYEFSLTASVGESLTKTAYAGDKTFTWSDGDQISVLFHKGDDNKFFTLTTDTGGSSSATFRGEITDGYTVGASDTGKYWALYPAGTHTYTAGADSPITFNIPGSTDFTAPGAHFSANLPLYAKGDDPAAYSFRHMCGTYKFQFKNLDVSKVKFIVENSSRALSGNITTTDGGIYLTQSGSAPAENKKITFIENVAGDKTAVFYVPYRGWHADFQPTITLKDADTDYTLYTRTAIAPFSGSMASTVSKMIVVPAISAPGFGYPYGVELTFTEADGEVPNPERGMMSYSKFVMDSASMPSVKSIPLDYTGESLAFLLFYTTYFMNEDLSDAALTFIRNEFDKVREANKKAIVRFAYTEKHFENTQHEATPTQVLKHVDQIADILADNADIIYAVQAGWLGTYGEWYYKTNNNGESVPAYDDYYKYTVDGSSVTDFNGNHANLLDKLLTVVPSPIHIGMRTPFYKRYYLSPSSINSWDPIDSWGTDANQRLAFFNDGIRGSATDVGTLNSATDKEMWYSQGKRLACGGEMSYRSEEEFAALPDSLKDADKGIAAMRRQHLSYLHYSESNRFMVKWIGEGRMEDIKKALGYRLVLGDVAFTYPALTSGSTMGYSIKLQNKGCAPVIYTRPFKLVLLHEGTPTVLVDDLGDIRDIAPGASATTLSGSFSLPQNIVAGDKLAIWLPDNTPGLRSNAAYSIRLANNEISWESGYNVLTTF